MADLRRRRELYPRFREATPPRDRPGHKASEIHVSFVQKFVLAQQVGDERTPRPQRVVWVFDPHLPLYPAGVDIGLVVSAAAIRLALSEAWTRVDGLSKAATSA